MFLVFGEVSCLRGMLEVQGSSSGSRCSQSEDTVGSDSHSPAKRYSVALFSHTVSLRTSPTTWGKVTPVTLNSSNFFVKKLKLEGS